MTHDDALPALPIGEAEVLWHEPDPVMPERPGKIIDASHAFMDAAPLGTRLYSAEQMRAYARAALAARAEPVGYVWVETHMTPDTPNGPAEYNEEMCFDTSPPTSGPYTPVYAAPPALPPEARDAMRMAADALRASPPATSAELVALIEAVDTLLESAPCECPRRMREERGEHLSHCYLFDLNVARSGAGEKR